MGFDAAAAHHMALLAMEQFGCSLASFGPPYAPAASEAAMRRLLARRKVPIWMASRMALAAADIPASWDVDVGQPRGLAGGPHRRETRAPGQGRGGAHAARVGL